MSHLSITHAVDILGLLAGVLGVSIAIWLQLVTRKRCRPRYVASFFILGSALILINLEPFWINPQEIIVSRVIAYVGLIVGQLYAAKKALEESEAESLSEVASHMAKLGKGKGD